MLERSSYEEYVRLWLRHVHLGPQNGRLVNMRCDVGGWVGENEGLIYCIHIYETVPTNMPECARSSFCDLFTHVMR